jgi:SsrA-binding protein
MSPKQTGIHVVARNRKARHEFSIEDTYEAGIVLVGSEVKSLRTGDCSINEAYAAPRDGELYVIDMHIAPYAQATIDKPEPKRPRKLLLHRKELSRIISQVSQKGYTLVPLSVYFKAGYAKIEIALARRKKIHDKRRASEERTRKEDMRRELGRR